MTTVKSGKLLKLSNVPKFFLDLAERRNADDKGIFFHKYDKTAEIQRQAERFDQQRAKYGESLGRSSTLNKKLRGPKLAEKNRQALLAEAVFERVAGTQESGQTNGQHNTDVAIVRYNEYSMNENAIISCLNRSLEAKFIPESVNLTNTVHVVSKKGLTNLFRKQDIDEQWKAIESIQLTVKAALGCGYPIMVNFFAPVSDVGDSFTPIDYVLDSFGED